MTAGDGTGYVGIWASAPSTAATTIASGNGTGTSHPFETAASTTLGPIPAATATVPANTPVAFTLMIARNGGNLDIHARFSDGASYIPSQNLLNIAVADFTYDSVAFLMTGNLNATQGSFSNIGIETGQVLPAARASQRLDHLCRCRLRRFRQHLRDRRTAELTPRGYSPALRNNSTQWDARTGANQRQALPSIACSSATDTGNPSTIPQLTTRSSGLADGTYTIWVFFWDQVGDQIGAPRTGCISAGLTSGSLTTYRAPNQPINVDDHDLATPVLGQAAPERLPPSTSRAHLDYVRSPALSKALELERRLFGVNLGPVTAVGWNHHRRLRGHADRRK